MSADAAPELEDNPGARYVFLGFLGVVLLVGLYWAIATGEEEGPVAVNEAGEEPTEVAEPTPEPEATEAPVEETEPPEEDDGPDQEVLDAAEDPGDTTIQVLDAGGGDAATDAAVEVLTELGYEVVVVNDSTSTLDETTVRWTDGHEAEARALRERDPRFAVVEENEGLSDAVDLHVMVGTDWEA